MIGTLPKKKAYLSTYCELLDDPNAMRTGQQIFDMRK